MADEHNLGSLEPSASGVFGVCYAFLAGEALPRVRLKSPKEEMEAGRNLASLRKSETFSVAKSSACPPGLQRPTSIRIQGPESTGRLRPLVSVKG